ncbi:hypothetical protein FF1_037260 [Malus domestica]
MAARTIFISVAVLALGQFVSSTFFGKIHIDVENTLVSNTVVELHCKSKSDDLGNHVIPHGGAYNFTFHDDFWDRTLFFCYMQWRRSDGKWVKAAFNIYKPKRDQKRCMHRCKWQINEYGIFSFTLDTKVWTNFYKNFTIEDRASTPNNAPPSVYSSLGFITLNLLLSSIPSVNNEPFSKYVWDLSDQDNDSMLSLREFCFSLYLMERYREGRPLPDTLPHNVMHDETLLSMTGQPKNAAWSPNPGYGQYQGMQSGQHQGMQGVAPAAGLRPPLQRSLPQADGALQPNQQNLRVRGMEGLNTTQHDNGKQDLANSKTEEDAGKKAIFLLLFIPTYTILLQVLTVSFISCGVI